MPQNRPTGRKVTHGAGSGGVHTGRKVNVGGPVGGGYSRPSGGGSVGGGDRGSGTRSTGGTVLTALAALLIGKAVLGGGNNNGSNGNSGGGSSKSGCLRRIILYAVIAVVIYFVVKSCSGGGLSGLTGYDDSAAGLPVYEEPAATEVPAAATAAPSAYETLFGNTTSTMNAVQTAPAASDVYKAHEPDYTVADAARARYTTVSRSGQDAVTVMVYMCGADLESQSGMGTSDLQEMLSATIGSNVNILVETGGAKYWQNQVVSSSTNQIYQIKQGGMKRLESNLGKKSMTKASTLTAFIEYCAENFPADRNILILWDHGGGSITGYGYDELFASDGSMALDQFNKALSNVRTDTKFDFIGFDACLMATLETALVCDQYADYLIASEATEPGTGWYYTDWITALSKNTSISTVDLGKIIIDDFVKYSAQNAPESSATLSLMDLAELHGTVPAAFRAFGSATGELISGDGFQLVANARSGAKDFSASSRINQIDLIHFADNLNTDESNALASALRGMVKYNRNGRTISNANGVSIYFPYNSLGKVSTALATYQEIGIDSAYVSCVRSFASMAAGGSLSSGGSDNALGSLLGDSSYGSLLGSLLGSGTSGSSTVSGADYSGGSADAVGSLLELFLGGDRSVVTGDRDSSWIDEDLLRSSADYLSTHTAGFDSLLLTEKDGQTVLALTEEQWAQIKTLEMNVFYDDGEGYVDLGLDTVMNYNDDGDLVMDYDGSWLSINGQICSYYFVSEDRLDDGAYTIVGRVPALLTHHQRSTTENALLDVDGRPQDYMQANRDVSNKVVTEYVNLIVVFSSDNENGTVVGALKDYREGSASVMKGLIPIQAGDAIQFLCDRYTYDGTYTDSYELNDPITYAGEWTVTNLPVGGRAVMMYRITDCYGAKYWTPSVTVG